MGQRGKFSLSIISGGAANAYRRDTSPPESTTLAVAVALLRANEIRKRMLGPQLSAEPAWNIMLELYARKSAGNLLSLTSACLSSGVSDSAAVRWIAMLIGAGLIQRTPDPSDGRGSLVELTAIGLKKIERALDAISKSEVSPRLGDLHERT